MTVIEGRQKFLKVSALVYWSDGVLRNKDINSLVITPILQYSNTTKLFEIENYDDGIPFFGDRFVTLQGG